MYPKGWLVEETKGGGKEGKVANNHICVGTRYKETYWKLKKHRMGEKGKEVQWMGGYIDLSTMHEQVWYQGKNPSKQWIDT
jgi:hypothetical protein